MSLLAIPYALLILIWFPSCGPDADILAGLRACWNPAVMLFLQALWIIMFLRTGRSDVTGSSLSFHVHRDRI